MILKNNSGYYIPFYKLGKHSKIEVWAAIDRYDFLLITVK